MRSSRKVLAGRSGRKWKSHPGAAISVLSLLLLVGTVALWALSYSRFDRFYYDSEASRTGTQWNLDVWSYRGTFECTWRMRREGFWGTGSTMPRLIWHRTEPITAEFGSVRRHYLDGFGGFRQLGFGFAAHERKDSYESDPDGWSPGATEVTRDVWMPYWPLAAAFALVPLVQLIRSSGRRRRRRLEAGLCGRCGYDLRASPGRCPECGADEPRNHGDAAGVPEGGGRLTCVPSASVAP